MTKDEARERVARGAALLDEKWPGWAKRIDTGRLDLLYDTECVLEQLCGCYCHAVQIEFGWPVLFGGGTVRADSPQAMHGFTAYGRDVPEDSPKWRRLQDAWIDAIADRLHPVESVEPAQVRDAVATPVGEG